MEPPEKSSLESEIAYTLEGRLTIFNLLWAVLSLAGGIFLGSHLARALVSPGDRMIGLVGRYAGSVIGYVLGFLAAGACAWLLLALVLWIGLWWILRQKVNQ